MALVLSIITRQNVNHFGYFRCDASGSFFLPRVVYINSGPADEQTGFYLVTLQALLQIHISPITVLIIFDFDFDYLPTLIPIMT